MTESVFADIAIGLAVCQRTTVVECKLYFDYLGIGDNIKITDSVFVGKVKRICTG